MCGRYYFESKSNDERVEMMLAQLEKYFPGSVYKCGEICPGDTAPALIEQGGKIVAAPATFGFPGLQDGRLLINARAETAEVKPTFAESLRERRLVLPATGFFEWSHRADHTKYLFEAQAYSMMYLCGIYKLIEGQLRFAILTRAANDSMIEIHDRMPVIINDSKVRAYLTDRDAAFEIIRNEAPILKREAIHPGGEQLGLF